jgi:hypothetical protein
VSLSPSPSSSSSSSFFHLGPHGKGEKEIPESKAETLPSSTSSLAAPTTQLRDDTTTRPPLPTTADEIIYIFIAISIYIFIAISIYIFIFFCFCFSCFSCAISFPRLLTALHSSALRHRPPSIDLSILDSYLHPPHYLPRPSPEAQSPTAWPPVAVTLGAGASSSGHAQHQHHRNYHHLHPN